MNSVVSSYFGGMYIVYKSDGTKEVITAPIESGNGEWSVDDFGESVERVDVVFANFDQREAGISPITRYELTATLSEDGISHAVSGNSSIKDGDLIRAVNTDDIYIVKLVGDKKFRRLILNPDIFDSYGHLRWEDVKDVSFFALSRYTISSLVTEVNSDGSVVDGRIFWLTSTQNSDKGTKRWLNVEASRFEYMGYDWDSIYKINHLEAGDSFYYESTPIII